MARSASSYSDFAAMASRSIRPTWGIRLWASAWVKRLDMGVLRGVVTGHVGIQDIDEFGHDVVALEGGHQAAIHVDRGLGFFERAGQRNAEDRVLGFARPVDHAAHYRHLHRLHARV